MNKKDQIETRQERREKKLRKKRERMAQHGKSLAKVYTEAVGKRAKSKLDKGGKS